MSDLSEKASPTLSISHRWDCRVVYLLKGSNLRAHVCSLESYEGSFVAHLVTIVGCTEHGKHFASLLIFISFWLYFVTSYQ